MLARVRRAPCALLAALAFPAAAHVTVTRRG
jgi:hypothetical protein